MCKGLIIQSPLNRRRLYNRIYRYCFVTRCKRKIQRLLETYGSEIGQKRDFATNLVKILYFTFQKSTKSTKLIHFQCFLPDFDHILTYFPRFSNIFLKFPSKILFSTRLTRNSCQKDLISKYFDPKLSILKTFLHLTLL